MQEVIMQEWDTLEQWLKEELPFEKFSRKFYEKNGRPFHTAEIPEAFVGRYALFPTNIRNAFPVQEGDLRIFSMKVGRNHLENQFFLPGLDIFIHKYPRYSDPDVHANRFFEVCYVYEGSCEAVFRMQGEGAREQPVTVFLQEGDFLFVPPGQVFQIKIFSAAIMLNIGIRRSTFRRIFSGSLPQNSYLGKFFSRTLSGGEDGKGSANGSGSGAGKNSGVGKGGANGSGSGIGKGDANGSGGGGGKNSASSIRSDDSNDAEEAYLLFHTGNAPQIQTSVRLLCLSYCRDTLYAPAIMNAQLGTLFLLLLENYQTHVQAAREEGLNTKAAACELEDKAGSTGTAARSGNDVQERKGKRPPEKVAPVIRYIEENYAHATVKETARHFGYSADYLNVLFKQAVSMTMGEMISRLKMQKAAELLDATDLPVEAIAEYLNYRRPTNFIRSFKAFSGYTPAQYRKR